MPGKPKKSGLDVGYLKTATSNVLASSVFATSVQQEEQRLLHEKQPEQIAIERLLDNPYQPRLSIEAESLQQLSETISSHGFQGVLVARPHPQQAGFYQLTAGHRRREAAKKAGLIMLPVIVHPWSNQDMATLAVTENIQREDLSPLEEGRLFQSMITDLGLTQIEVANEIKKDRGYVRNRLRLANAPSDIQTFVATKTDSMRAVIYLLDIEDPAERAPLIEQLLKKTLTTEDLPAYLEELRQRKSAYLAIPEQNEVLSSQPLTEMHQGIVATSELEIAAGATTPDASTHTHLSSTVSPRDQSQERVRQLKLKTIVRYLTEYRRCLANLSTIPQEEVVLLRQIEVMVQDLA